MSRMTKFLKQTCTYEKAKRDSNGNVELDTYGEVQYQPSVIVKCRREKTIRDVQSTDGAILRNYTRYFVDETVAVEASDRIDGRIVLGVEEYINQLGKVEGYECYV